MAYKLKGKPRSYFKWVDANGNDCKIGTSFRGIFVESGEDVFKDKPTYHAIFTDDNGDRVQVSCPTVLKGLLEEAEPGMDLKIVFTGYLAKKVGQNAAKNFEVECLNRDEPPAREPKPNRDEQTAKERLASDRQEPNAQWGQRRADEDVPF
jgi:hypothetical protein